ncbi:MAG: ATP-binding protein [Methanobrevibacter sp.]|nr:ATP-binding protein [Methanobrevibacter sp.]
MLEREGLISNFIRNELNDVPNILNRELSKNNKKFNTRDELDEIKGYVNTFLNEDTSNKIVVLPGLRGVGKTTLILQLYEYLLKEMNIPPRNILYVSFDDLNDFVECNIRQMVEIYLKDVFHANLRTLNEKVFIFIDESQIDKKWAKTGKIIYDKSYNIFIIFTGSSALHLEQNDDLARRMRKKSLTPLNYTQHLKLKYDLNVGNLSNDLRDMIFSGNIDSAVKSEFETNNLLTNCPDYSSNDWDEYFKVGAFPILFDKKTHREICEDLVEITERVITKDMSQIKEISSSNQSNAKRILRYFALQQPGELTHANLANYLKTSTANVNKILDLLEKTHLIFHCEPYGGSAKRVKKSWKYYFATPSIRHALSRKVGNPLLGTEDYEGLLLENLIASNLFNLSNREFTNFTIYYDANKKTNVDFLIQEESENIIPIEVGRGKKKKSQIKHAINKYDCEYGIVVANNTNAIKRKDDVIYIPPKTFSFL